MEGRNSKGQFAKGHKIATGRPKGSKNKITLDLYKAIEQVEKEKGKGLFKHFVERGFKSDNVLVALIKKLIADKTQIEGNLEGDVKVRIELVGSDGDKPPGKSKQKDIPVP